MLTSQKEWACKGEAPRFVLGGRSSRRESAEWALCHLRAFITCWALPLIVRIARRVWCYFAKYNGGIFYIIYIGKCNRH